MWYDFTHFAIAQWSFYVSKTIVWNNMSKVVSIYYIRVMINKRLILDKITK